MNSLNPNSPRSLVSMCIFDWDIPKPFIDQLDEYYIRHWSIEHYKAQACYGCLREFGIDYTTYYYQGILPKYIDNYKEILISFRRIRGWDRGYAIVRPKLGTEIIIPSISQEIK